MLLSTFKSRMISLLFISGFIVIFVLFFHYFQHKFLFWQLKELLFLLLLPISVCLGFLLNPLERKIGKSQSKISDLELSTSKINILQAIPILYSTYIIFILTIQPAGTAENNNNFLHLKEFIGWSGVIFGIYIGYIFNSFYFNSHLYSYELHSPLDTIKQIQKSEKINCLSDDTSLELKLLIAEGQIKDAIEKIKTAILSEGDSKNLLNQVITLSAQYSLHQERVRLSLTTDDTLSNKVAKGLTDIIDNI